MTTKSILIYYGLLEIYTSIYENVICKTGKRIDNLTEPNDSEIFLIVQLNV